ncbi:putative kinesin-domain-containing protein [Lyophyllum shimeji]|uniref:Kinesin-domain-containing protein n=1 Tax=Lyophyllum shimeji TaxID=47721 RepID=A0A9P3PGB7_LYOSH|nr:putative kinesin-domain-containing protein [Lyophyllum shimeji]
MPPVRTYPFDLVFGPEADQAMIYHEVVSPMLEEVLMGYNCTLFAYGQTGTGKTYTMQGDLNPTPMGNPSPDAGMIPRVLFRLFHHLETSKSDYSVKVSYIELYNEELRDLLANDLPAPNGTTQPMGMASKDANKIADSGLKIFDDVNKRGVTIQGLEEITVKDSQAALALLRKGSHRRQIAATKFNDHSSRSHSVFSITVHVKEPSIAGEDLLKVGKLNLVDLAGSENIGRSGAENKRAREAGMINQSLLTLGRVINALVDKASHIPYRESKLTRLLQDSLGGRTKTCIIATVSPARSNMEETLSTLDYAIRAKSIKNKPELNQRTTRNSLIKDYVAEIERLKADLIAAREKNGIFFSEETWTQMTAEQELRLTELQEAKKQVEIVEGQMRAVREEFDQSIGLLKKREGELKETRSKLQDSEVALARRTDELAVVKGALEEEVVVRKAHQDTEVALDQVASGLRKAANQCVKDIGGLFEKLERKTAILNANSQTVLTQGTIISVTSNALVRKLDEFVESSSQTVLDVRNETTEFKTKELETLASVSSRIDKQLQRLQEAFAIIQAKDDSEAEALGIAQKVMKETHETFRAGFNAWSTSLSKTCDETCRALEMVGTEAFGSVEAALTALFSAMNAIVQGTSDFLDIERENIRRVDALASEASRWEIVRLTQQNEALTKMLEAERMEADKAKDELMQRVSGLLGDFAAERDRSLREAVGVIQEGNRQGREGMETFMESHAGIMKQMETGSVEASEALQRRRGEGKRTRDGALKAVSTSKSRFSDALQKMQNSVSGSVRSYSLQVQKQTEAMSFSCSDAFERHSRAKRARIEATASMRNNAQSEYRHMREDIASTSRRIDTVAARVLSEASGLEAKTASYRAAVATNLASLEAASDALSEMGAREDVPTGATPRRRSWNYVDHWDLTKPRDTILRDWREQGISNVGSETFLAEHLPLPEDDGLDEDNETFELPQSSTEPENIPTPQAAPPPSKPPSKPAPTHKTLPSVGTLTDARNVYTTRGSRRAR